MLRQRHEELQTNETPRPLHRIHQGIYDSCIGFLGHVGDVCAEGLSDAVRMPAKEHPASHGNRKPLVSIASDRVGRFNSSEVMYERGRKDRRATPGRVNVEPEVLLSAKTRDLLQWIDDARRCRTGRADNHEWGE